MPKVKVKTAGRASITASNCAGNGSGGTAGSSGAGMPRRAWASASISSIGAASTPVGWAHPPANRFTPNGRSVSVRMRRTASMIWSGVM